VASLDLNLARLELLFSTGTLHHANRGFETLPSLGVTGQLTARRRWHDISVVTIAVLTAAAVLKAARAFSRAVA